MLLLPVLATLLLSVWVLFLDLVYSVVISVTVVIGFYAVGAITVVIVISAICVLSWYRNCLLYTSPSPRDGLLSRMPSSA